MACFHSPPICMLQLRQLRLPDPMPGSPYCIAMSTVNSISELIDSKRHFMTCLQKTDIKEAMQSSRSLSFFSSLAVTIY
ncbi:hypothetical protein LIER_19836 [Lithospermum erythrorhizon]|uniref:Uncharacterized protein n=1 Tax=Lithospermum erythrorhizon TaxID=34254 RepID=A0AAV3QLW4_LITER